LGEGRVVVSVVIASRGRPEVLAETVAALRDQSLPASDFEIVVVDDGSVPPLSLSRMGDGVGLRLVRLDGRERSAARNAGARAAVGDVLVFIDDDISVGREFVHAHLLGQREWPRALAVGSISLPDEALGRAFGRFRQELERQGIPRQRGLSDAKNFCTAANMSMGRERFWELGGFDEELVSAEDQDFALRHCERGGAIGFLPEAAVIHRDTALDIRSYCRRTEWGSERLMAFCRRHPTWPDNVERDRVNGPIRLGQEHVERTLRKLGKRMIALQPVVEVLFAVAAILERIAPESWLLGRVYRLLLGAHIFRGYRRGLAQAERVIGVERSRMAADRG
jgi:glycosyltransferase involved in cell wall biosynthesis